MTRAVWLLLLALEAVARSPDPAVFQDPPKQYRPWMSWRWFSNAASHIDLAWELEQVNLSGIGGVLINAAGLDLDSEEWRSRLTAVSREGEKRGIAVFASVAPATDSAVAAAECCTAFPVPASQVTLGMLKAASDGVFLDGFNCIRYRGDLSSPHSQEKARQAPQSAPPINHNQTWWPHYPALAKYAARMNYLMQSGTTVADVAVYSAPDPEMAEVLVKAGYRFEILKVNAHLRRYRALLLASPNGTTAAVKGRAAAFARAGGIVIDAVKPEDALRILDTRVGRGFHADGAAFRAIHRVSGEVGWYFIVNPDREERTAKIALRDARGPMQLWDPLTGERRAFLGGELTLGPWGSAVILYGMGARGLVQGPAPEQSLARAVEIGGPWWFKTEGTIYYASEWRELRNWLDVPDLKSFAGIGSYQTSFQVPETRTARLCLGRVEQSAEVLLNGESAGMVFLPPYCVDVSGRLRDGRNLLEVRVANVWGNSMGAKPALPGGLLGPVVVRFD